MIKASMFSASVAAFLTASAVGAVETGLKINLHNTGGVEAGTQAYYGFKTAAKFWESQLTTSQFTSLDINVGFIPLGDRILGSTRSSFTSRQVVNIENRIKARQFGAFDAQAAANLPRLSGGILGEGTALKVYTPGFTDRAAKTGIDNAKKQYDYDGSYNNSVIGLTTANAKALGYTFAPGTVDASINFSSTFAFDFNAKDGVADNSYDFVGVAIHEIGHALGFVSGVDDYDYLGTGGPLADVDLGGFLGKNYPANDDWFGETLDLFRYSGDKALDWTTKTPSYFSVDRGATAYQAGLFSTGTYNGDGNQASHWTDNSFGPRINPGCSNLTSASIGIMDPTFGACQVGVVTGLDLAAFDAIGYNTRVDLASNPTYTISTAGVSSFVPEPATWAMMIGGFGFVGSAMRRRRNIATA